MSAASKKHSSSAAAQSSPAAQSAETGENPAKGGNSAAIEHRFQSLIEHIDDAAMVIDAKGRIVFVNPSARRLLGYDLSGKIGEDIFQFLDESEVEDMRRSFLDLVAGRRLTVSLEMQAIRADGQRIDLDIVASSHFQGSIGSIVANVRDVTTRKWAERQAYEAERRYATIMESLVDGVMMLDASGVVVTTNEALESLFDAPPGWLRGRRLDDVLRISEAVGVEVITVDGDLVPTDKHPVMQSLATGEASSGVIHGIRRPNNSTIWLRINIRVIGGSDGRSIAGVVASLSDITEVRNTAIELRQEQRFLQVLLDNLEEGIMACDDEGRLTMVNPAARRMQGTTEESDPIGKTPSTQWLRRADGSPMPSEESPLVQALAGEHLREYEFMIVSRGGARSSIRANAQTLFDDAHQKLGAVVAMRDVTEQKQNEERLALLALHDPLTGVANRTLLADRLRQALEDLPSSTSTKEPPREAQPGLEVAVPGTSIAVFLLDLDDFKEVNDALGHDVGDDVLVAVARRLQAMVRPTDTVARLGGDEFVVVCQMRRGEEELERIAERISSALNKPYYINGKFLTLSASIGGVFTDDRSTDPALLLSQADDAMYGVKWKRRHARPPATH